MLKREQTDTVKHAGWDMLALQAILKSFKRSGSVNMQLFTHNILCHVKLAHLVNKQLFKIKVQIIYLSTVIDEQPVCQAVQCMLQ